MYIKEIAAKTPEKQNSVLQWKRWLRKYYINQMLEPVSHFEHLWQSFDKS